MFVYAHMKYVFGGVFYIYGQQKWFTPRTINKKITILAWTIVFWLI